MKPASEDLLKGLLKVTKAVVGIVVLLFVGTVVVIYFLVANPTAPVAEVSVADTEVTAEVAPAPTVASTLDIVDGKDVQTGLLAGEGLQLVKGTCTACHSSALILQNRFTREGWHEKIVWMQETQGLWDLGKNEDAILDYLAMHYAPEEFIGRRQPLTDIEWYELGD